MKKKFRECINFYFFASQSTDDCVMKEIAIYILDPLMHNNCVDPLMFDYQQSRCSGSAERSLSQRQTNVTYEEDVRLGDHRLESFRNWHSTSNVSAR